MKAKAKFRKGLKVDCSEWQVLRDDYLLLDPSTHIPRSPRFAFSDQPFLAIISRMGTRRVIAGIRRTDEGKKIWWIEWIANGAAYMSMCPDSLQELLFWLEHTLFETKRKKLRHPTRK